MSKKVSEEYLKKQTTVSIIGIICFFLPWYSSENVFDPILESGYDIAREGNIIFLMFPIGFIANIYLLKNKPNLIYIRDLLFAIPFIYMLSGLYEMYKAFEPYSEIAELFLNQYEIVQGESFIETLISFISYGLCGTIICILLIYFIPNRVTDVNDQDFGEI